MDNRYPWPWAALVIASSGAAPAAHGENANLGVLLNDAQYALNRYQELVNGPVCDELRVSEGVKERCAQTERAIGDNVERIKIVLLRASKTKNPSARDLLDIYSELEAVSDRLQDLSHYTSDFTTQDPSKYAEAGDKTMLLAAKLYVELRKRINALEKVCAQ